MRYLAIVTYVLTTWTASDFFVADAQAVNLSWNAAGGGKALNPTNWTPNQVPGLLDDLEFGLNNFYTVSWDDTIPNVDTIDVTAGFVTFDDLGTTFFSRVLRIFPLSFVCLGETGASAQTANPVPL